jgi:endonuclease YncB( thermonuclease family)
MSTPTFNQGVMGIDNIVLEGEVTFDPHTVLTVPREPNPPTRVMTVANGSTVLVYDVTNPANPILIRTIG